MKRVLIDTNAYSHLFRGNKVVEKEISGAGEVLVSVITLGELYLGFNEGGMLADNLKNLGRFLSKSVVRIVNVDANVAMTYGRLKYELRRRGTPISDNDIWIGAQVVEAGAELVSYDRHFLKIPGLKVWRKLK